jgi:hypothetical protein
MKKLVSKSTRKTVNTFLLWLGLGFLALTLFLPLFPVTAVAEGGTANVYQTIHGFFTDVKTNFNENMWLYAFVGALLVGAYYLIFKTPGLVKLGIKSKDEKGIKQILLWAVILFVGMVVIVPLFPVTAVAVGANPTVWQAVHGFFNDIFVHLQSNYQIYGASILVLGAAYYFLVLKKK